MRKRLRVDATRRHFLQSIVANGSRSIEPFINVTRLQYAFGLRTMRPYTGIAVSLQF